MHFNKRKWKKWKAVQTKSTLSATLINKAKIIENENKLCLFFIIGLIMSLISPWATSYALLASHVLLCLACASALHILNGYLCWLLCYYTTSELGLSREIPLCWWIMTRDGQWDSSPGTHSKYSRPWKSCPCFLSLCILCSRKNSISCYFSKSRESRAYSQTQWTSSIVYTDFLLSAFVFKDSCFIQSLYCQILY